VIDASQYGAGIAALIVSDHAAVDEPRERLVREQVGIASLDDRPRVGALFGVEEAACDGRVDDVTGQPEVNRRTRSLRR